MFQVSVDISVAFDIHHALTNIQSLLIVDTILSSLYTLFHTTFRIFTFHNVLSENLSLICIIYHSYRYKSSSGYASNLLEKSLLPENSTYDHSVIPSNLTTTTHDSNLSSLITKLVFLFRFLSNNCVLL
ncbi:MAG: hypothetical protein Q8S84_05175 [bacterium]|nr:hypothetical protein [bacterium]